LRGSGRDDELDADAEFWGIDPALIQPEEAIGLWEIHAAALHAFLVVESQWRVVSLAQGGLMWVGLDYSGVRAGLRGAGLKLTPDQWSEMQMIETGALNALNRVRMQ
jgi:hypothetical protein